MKNILSRRLSGLALVLSLVAAFAVGIFAAANNDGEKFAPNFDWGLYNQHRSNQVDSIEELSIDFEKQQEEWLPVAPPGDEYWGWMQDAFPSPVSFNPKAFPTSFIKGLVPMERDGLTFYSISILEDPVTRERRIFNSQGIQIASIPSASDYDPQWAAWEILCGLGSGQWTEEEFAAMWPTYDPSHLLIDYELIQERDLLAYIAVTSERETVAKSSSENAEKGGVVILMRSLLADSALIIDGITKATNGVKLEIGYPATFTNRLEVFGCTNLIQFSWSLVATNLSTTGTNTIFWTDTAATNIAVRFYAIGNADLNSDTDPDSDGLTWAREQYLYRANPTNSDTDGDGLVDGYSGIVATNSYPSGIHTGQSAFVEGELTWGTGVSVVDSDQDGCSDGWEVANGHNPLDENDPPNLSGTIGYAGRQTGFVWVVAMTSSNSFSTNFSQKQSSLGSFHISPLPASNFWLMAWIDSSDDDLTNAAEAVGFPANPVTVTNRVTGIDFILHDPDVDSDQVPDWWEIEYFTSTSSYGAAHDPDGDQYGNLEEYNAATDPTNSLSHPWNLSGVVTYAGPQTGFIHVIAVETTESWTTNHECVVTGPGSYSITHLSPGVDYWIKAWRDADANCSNEYWEARGSYGDNPVCLSGNIGNIDFSLVDPDTDGDEVADWFEVAYGMDPLNGAGLDAAAWWKLDETSGIDVADSGINSNSGTLHGYGTWTNGLERNALLLDGSTGYVECEDDATLKPEFLSLSLWLKPSINYTNGSLAASFISKKQAGTASGYSLTHENGAVRFTICSGGAKTLTLPYALTNGVWHHVAATYSGSSQQLYMDGSLVAQTNYNWGTGYGYIDHGTMPVRLGASADTSASNFFFGALDDARIYGNGLSGDEIQSIFELGADPDSDGVSSFQEYLTGSCPTNSDTDGDHIPDAWEIQHGLLPSSPADATEDLDGDGYLNIYEFIHDTDPASSSSLPAPDRTIISGVTTIQAAIDASSNDYDVIMLSAGTYTGAGNRNIVFKGKKLMLVSAVAPGQAIIDCYGPSARGFAFTNGETRASVLSGLKIMRAQELEGGGLFASDSSPSILSCILTNNTAADFGGAISCVGASSPLIKGCLITGNTADYGGGIALDVSQGLPVLLETTVSYNDSLEGGGIYSLGDCLITNCVVIGNFGYVSGGGVYCYGSNSAVRACQILENIGYCWGAGGIAAYGESVLDNNLIQYNQAYGFEGSEAAGGGIVLGDNATARDCAIVNNSVEWGDGAGVRLDGRYGGTSVLERCEISGNTIVNSGFHGNGGGVFSGDDSTNLFSHEIRFCLIEDNTASGSGGGICSKNLSLVVRGSSVYGNSAARGGGMAYLAPKSATNTIASPRVENSILSGNHAVVDGGGLYVEALTGTLSVVNCTLVGNAANGYGGSLYASNSSQVEVLNSVLWSSATTEVVAANSLLGISYSCVQGGYAGVGNITNNPVPHGDGSHIYGTNSPCFNAGSSVNAPADDFDGEPRPWAGSVDIGADEFIDIDWDGLPDWFEKEHFGDATSGEPSEDSDGDTLTNQQEYDIDTNPTGELIDSDVDGLYNDVEVYYGTDLVYWDSDNDGMSDAWEISSGFDPSVWNDPNADTDSDGWTDIQEGEQGTDPTAFDSDGDGVKDSEDADPLDPTNSEVADDSNTCMLTLMVGDSSGSHTELYGMQLGTFRLFMSHVSATEYLFYKIIRVPRQKTYEGYVEALGDSDDDGDYDADVTGNGITLSDPNQVLGGHHEDTGFNSGMRSFSVFIGSAPGDNEDESKKECSRNPEDANSRDPINTMNGNVSMKGTDIVIPCPGLDIVFRRSYDNQSSYTNSPIGACWSHNYSWRLDDRTNALYRGVRADWKVLNDPEGIQHWFRQQTSNSWAAPRDNNLLLSKTNEKYRVESPGKIVSQFDTNGLLETIGDPAGNTLSFAYSGVWPNQSLTNVQHNNGQYIGLSYVSGRISSISTPVASFNMSYSYNVNGELTNATRQTASVTNRTAYLYDASTHSVTQRLNAAGDKYSYGYEYVVTNGATIARGVSMSLNTNYYYKHTLNYTNQGLNKTQLTYTRGSTNQAYIYQYDPVMRYITAIYGPNGTNLGTRMVYDDSMNKREESIFDDQSGDTLTVHRNYDGRHNLACFTTAYNSAPGDNWWQIQWDDQYQLPASIQDPLGGKIEMAYTNGLLARTKAYWSQSSFYETTYGYTSNSLLSGVTNANGHWVKFGYDSYGFMTSSVPQIGPVVAYANSRLGWVTNVAIPGPSGMRNTRIGVNELGWVTNIVYPDNLTETFKYDVLGNLTNQVDRAGRYTRYTYLPGRKLSSVTRQLASGNLTTSIAYDNQFNNLKITDAKGRAVESYKLDLQDRPLSVTNLEGQAMNVNWGVGGFVKSVTRFDGTTVYNQFNSNGWISAVGYPGTTNSFSYLANGLMQATWNGQGAISNTWNFANRLASSAFSVSGLSVQPSVSYSYYPAGQVSNVTSIAGTSSYTLDEADRLSALTVSQPSVAPLRFALIYGSNGLVESVVCTNTAVSVSNRFDVMDRLTNIVWKNSSTLASFGYLYNNAGMITQKVSVVKGSAVTNRYSYDDLDRLTAETISGAATSSATFTYDLVGNRTNAIINGVTNTYAYSNGCDRLVSWGRTNESKAWFTPAGCVTTLQYAATNKLFLTWNQEYQVTAIGTSSTVIVERNGYDALGRRAWNVGWDGTTTTNFFVYSGADLIADVDRTGGLRRAYAYGPGIDNILSMTVYTGTTVKTYFYIKDHLGTVHAVTDSTGTNIVERYGFDAWGKVLEIRNAAGTKLTTSAIGNRFLWQGREYSWKTGLYNFRARWYEPITGRWLSNDPIGISGGLSQYVFCGNNPVNCVDPFGLVFKWGRGVTEAQKRAISKSLKQVNSTAAGRALVDQIQNNPTAVYLYAKDAGGRSGINEQRQQFIAIQSGARPGMLGHEMQHTAEAICDEGQEDPAGLGVISALDPAGAQSSVAAENRAVRAQNIINHQFYSSPNRPIPISVPPITTYGGQWDVPQPYGTKYTP